MNIATEEVKDQREKNLLDLMARLFQRMQDRAIELRQLPTIARVFVQFQPLQDKNGPAIVGYVDAFLTNGESVCWFISIRWTPESWEIETALEERRDRDDYGSFDLGLVIEGDFSHFAMKLESELEKLLATTPPTIQL